MRISDWSSYVCSSDLLGHEDHANLFDRIDEETGRKHAAPVKIAGRSGNARARRIERDREAEPEPDPGIFILAENADAVLRKVAAAGQMVRRHQGERLAADDPHIAELEIGRASCRERVCQ